MPEGGEKRRIESLFQRMLRKAVETPGDVRARENRACGSDGENAASPGAGPWIEAGGDDFERRRFSGFDAEAVEPFSFGGDERRQIAGGLVIRKKGREGGEGAASIRQKGKKSRRGDFADVFPVDPRRGPVSDAGVPQQGRRFGETTGRIGMPEARGCIRSIGTENHLHIREAGKPLDEFSPEQKPVCRDREAGAGKFRKAVKDCLRFEKRFAAAERDMGNADRFGFGNEPVGEVPGQLLRRFAF